MKKSFVLIFVLICAVLSVLSVSASPRDRYYDQLGNKHWCNSDSYGCWVTGENGEHEYIMFWSESARDAIMGPGSKAPIGTNPGASELGLAAPKPVSAASGGGTTNPCPITDCPLDQAPEYTRELCEGQKRELAGAVMYPGQPNCYCTYWCV